jgi:hypothetical protein
MPNSVPITIKETLTPEEPSVPNFNFTATACYTCWGTGIAQSVLRQATGWTAGFESLVELRDLSLLHRVRTSSGAQPAYPIDTGGQFLGGKATGA